MHIDKFKGDDGGYVDTEGCWWETAEDFIHSHILGFCGCGAPQLSIRYVRDVLKHIEAVHALPRGDTRDDWGRVYDEWKEAGKAIFSSEGAEYFAYYVMDDKGLTEHGGSVPGWLTELGLEVMEDLDEILAEEIGDGNTT